MSTFTKPSAVVALTLAKDTDINDLADAVEEAFDLIPDETRLERGTTNYVVAAGAGNAYTVSMPTTLAAYVDGYEVVMKANHTNTGAATIDIDGLGAKSLRRQYGEALAAGDIRANKIVPFRYNSTSGYFEMQLITTGNMADVATVAGISGNVSTVAAISANVTTVAGNTANINTVAGISANVTTVAGDTANIGTIATDLNGADTIGVVAGNITDIQTVAGIDAAVSAVAAVDAAVVVVATDLSGADTIGIVAADLAGADTIGAVAGIAANVSTVAGISGNVTTVAGIHANVTTVAGIAANVSTVAGDSADIGTIATDLNGANTIGTVAGISADVTTVAGISADVTAVAGDSADIGTVAADLGGADGIGTCATNIADIQDVAAMALLVETAEKVADYTLALVDAGKIVAMNKAGAAALTVPTNAAVAFPVGAVVGVYNLSVDAVTIAGDGVVTVRNAGDLPQYGECSLRKRDTDEWVLVGDVS